ncbi:MAG: CaiB/BaiF CoA-transferase family protein [Hyphomonadaceae bacterium]
MSERPLTGLRVLDFSRVLAGPYATRMLSDLGADVLKIEPPEGDITRHFGKLPEGVSGYYMHNNIGKRNISIDLKAEGARALILDLAAKADLVVENFRPGIMDRFGIGWADLSAVNPKLVMVSISGFGQDGPDRDRAAYAPIIHAESGVLARQARTTGQPPADIMFSMADTYSSLHGLVGAFAALTMAERTGKGQHVDIAMINVMHATDDYAPYILDGVWPIGNESYVWDAPEGRQILVSGELKWLWHVYSNQAGLSADLPPDADIKTKIAARRAKLAERFAGHASFRDLTDELDALNLPWGLVRDVGEDAFSQSTVQASKMIVEVEDDVGNPRRAVQSPYKFSDASSGISADTRPPKRGEHNLEALSDWLGLGQADVDGLAAKRILLSEDDPA